MKKYDDYDDREERTNLLRYHKRELIDALKADKVTGAVCRMLLRTLDWLNDILS